MVERLSNGQSYTISSISEGLTISRQGARKHLQILADAHIIALTRQGRDTSVKLDPKTLAQCKKFITTLEMHWDTRLKALKVFVEKK
jgi:DNA-binding transcriptional ArsR family regulator